MMGNNQTYQLDKLMAISLNKLKDYGVLKKFYIREIRREDAISIRSIENEELQWMAEYVKLGKGNGCNNSFKWPHE